MSTLENALADQAKRSVHKTWLVVMPASGSVRRMTGALLLADVGGETKWSPFIVRGNVAVALDPRALVVEDLTLRVGYHPRENLDRVHKAAAEWYAKNPDVFNPETKSCIAPL